MQYVSIKGNRGVPDDGYKRLGCAVAERAIYDYRIASMIEMPRSRSLAQKQLKKFFLSQWCHNLCGISSGVWEDFFDAMKKQEPVTPVSQGLEKSYAELLCELIKKHGITQARLAEEIGVHKTSVSGYVNGIISPREKNKILIKEFFDSLET